MMERISRNKKGIILLSLLAAILFMCGAAAIFGVRADGSVPEITVNYAGYSEDALPKGFVDSPYTVYGATVYDAEDEAPQLTVTVYKNYSIPSARYMVNVIDGAFTPESTGFYAIEYVATNFYGNTAQEVVAIEVVNSGDEITVTAPDLTSVKQGTVLTVPEGSANGDEKFGSVTVAREIYFGSEKMTDYDGGNTYVPLRVGTYTVKFIAKDYAGRTASVDKTVKITANTELVAAADVTNLIPKYIVEDVEYTLPALEIYEFNSDGRTLNPCAITVNNEAVQGNRYVGKVTADGEDVSIKYTYKTFEKTFTVKGVKKKDASGLSTIGLFVKTDATTAFNADDALVVTATGANGGIEFANMLAADRMGAVFSCADAGRKVTFTITDAYNPEEKITLTFSNNNLSVNGAADRPINAAFDGSSIEFTVRDNTVTVGRTAFLISGYAGGGTFNGFSSKIVYMGMTLDAAGEAKLIALADENISPYNDYSEPRAYYSATFDYSYFKNDVFDMPSVIVSDLVDGIMEGKLSVTYNGQAISDVDGTLLDKVSANRGYSVRLENYGEYQVKIEATDSSGNRLNRIFVIRVRDDIKPEVGAYGAMPQGVKVGEQVFLPDGYASDNIAGNLEVYILAIDPHGVYSFVSNQTFTPDKAGVWTIKYFAYDVAGNLGYAEYTLTVSEAE